MKKQGSSQHQFKRKHPLEQVSAVFLVPVELKFPFQDRPDHTILQRFPVARQPCVEGEQPLNVALLDLGCKKNIVRCLCKRGCRVTVLPGTATAADLAALHADGLMSNGPGDPAENVQIIQNIREMLDTGIPAFGICLGHQLTALAAGARTTKLKYGHRGANQPATEFATGRTFITSQNHGYAVVGDTLPADVGAVSHVNANDKTCEGVAYTKWNCFTVQFHPEASGGPKDTEYLFDRFVERMKQAKGGL